MPRLKSGTLGVLVLALLTAGASASLGVGGNAIECERLAPLAVLAVLSAFVVALCFRILARSTTTMQRWQLAVALVLAGASLFINARFIRSYRGPCNQIEKQLHQSSALSSK
jgi:hypothetical protein